MSSPTPPEKLIIRPLAPGEENAWDRLVEESAEGTFFHLSGWARVLEEAFGHPIHYLAAWRGEEIHGILPLARINSLLFGDGLISTPFCVEGGVVARDEETRLALEQAAVQLARDLRVGWLEMRHTKPRQPTWVSRDLYYAFRKKLDPDPGKVLLSIPRKQRAEVRKGMAMGLWSEVDDTPDRVWEVYSESVRNLGTPVFSRHYFRVLQRVFGQRVENLLVRDREGVVSAVMSFYFRDEVLPYYGGATTRGRAGPGTHFMYFEVMRRAVERGVGVFDFGRSKRGTGSFDFKRWFGFDPTPLHYEYLPVTLTAIPEVNPLNPKYRGMVALWKRLPLPVSRWLGPWLARDLG